MNHMRVCPSYSPELNSEIWECWPAVHQHVGRKTLKARHGLERGQWALKGSTAGSIYRRKTGEPGDGLAEGMTGTRGGSGLPVKRLPPLGVLSL